MLLCTMGMHLAAVPRLITFWTDHVWPPTQSVFNCRVPNGLTDLWCWWGVARRRWKPSHPRSLA
jgi:hypothetical protein